MFVLKRIVYIGRENCVLQYIGKMNYTLQLHGERMRFAVPSGLYELMSDIAREVLRDQPSLLYQYIAHYMDTLVRVREYARSASHVVNGVTQENVELLSFVSSLGVPYEMADLAARKIQRAFRAYRAKHTIKRAFQEQQDEMSMTESFREFLETYSLDQETADRASEVIQSAYRVYQSKKEAEQRSVSKDASTYTIESIPLKPLVKTTSLSRQEKPPKRDSKLLVYQQSPRGSFSSAWSKFAPDFPDKEKTSPSLAEVKDSKLIFEQAEEPSVVEENRESLPSYYDESQPKIPMISESGLLVSEETSDIVTLYSTDSVDVNRQFRPKGEDIASLPSLTNLSPTSKPEDLAKELFDIIGNKTSSTSKSARMLKSLSKDSSAIVKKSSSVSIRKTTSTDRAS